MKYYKKIDEDGTLKLIGTAEDLAEEQIEITEKEYEELKKYIEETAVHIDAQEMEENENGIA